MKRILLITIITTSITTTGCPSNNVNNVDLGLGLAGNLIQNMTKTNEQAASQAIRSVKEMDERSKIVPSRSKYMHRINRLTKNLKNYDGLTLNYKAYISDKVNASAWADGRLFTLSSDFCQLKHFL